jgi:hypothetical protein
MPIGTGDTHPEYQSSSGSRYYPFFKGYMALIASVAVSSTPRAIGWSAKLSVLQDEFASRISVGIFSMMR